MSPLEIWKERCAIFEEELAWADKHLWHLAELGVIDCHKCVDSGINRHGEICHDCRRGRALLYDDPDSFESDPTTFYSRRSNSEP